MMFQSFDSCGCDRDRGFHFMGHIIDEVSLYFIDPFLPSDGFIYKHEGSIANEQDKCKR
jgi:hypothetical protein